MKKLFTIFMLAATIVGCSYNDDDLWNKVDDLDSRLKSLEQKIEEMNSDIGAMQTIVDAIESGLAISQVEETADGLKIIMTDGSSFSVNNGSAGPAGTNAPVIGVRQHSDNNYYWTVTTDGIEKWLPDNDAPTLRVTGSDGAAGHTPSLSVDSQGYWTVDGERIANGVGGYVKASGADGADGADGDSFFESVDTSSSDRIVFTLQNGTTFTVPCSNSRIAFEDGKKALILNYGSTAELALAVQNIEFAEVLSVTEGWSASIDTDAWTVTVTAAAAGGKESGLVTVIGLDEGGNTLMAARRLVAVPDYTDPAGTWLLNEGNTSVQDGTIIWYDAALNEYRDIYQKSNGGRTIGHVLEDMYIAEGKAYFVCQNGSSMGGDGQLVICDASTMVAEKIYDDLDFQRRADSRGCPQHLVVVGDKAFIQYVDHSYEYNSGIRVLDLGSETLRENDIAGTYGPFGTEGAFKGRMIYSKGQIIAGLAKAVVFIDPATEAVTKRIDFEGGVKDIVKGADGNLYVAVTGDFTTPQGYYDPSPAGSKIYAYSQAGEFISSTTLSEVAFSTSTAYTNIGMSASFDEPYLYFNPDTDMMAMDFTSRFDYSTGTLTKIYVRPQQYSYVYGYTGVHPLRKELFVAGNPNYSWTRLTVYDISDQAAPTLKKDTNRDYRNYTASPAGVFFTYSFSSAFIDK